jgi:hypothetical protein
MASGAKAVVPISAAVKIVASFLVIFVPSFHRSQLAGGDISSRSSTGSIGKRHGCGNSSDFFDHGFGRYREPQQPKVKNQPLLTDDSALLFLP